MPLFDGGLALYGLGECRRRVADLDTVFFGNDKLGGIWDNQSIPHMAV